MTWSNCSSSSLPQATQRPPSRRKTCAAHAPRGSARAAGRRPAARRPWRPSARSMRRRRRRSRSSASAMTSSAVEAVVLPEEAVAEHPPGAALVGGHRHRGVALVAQDRPVGHPRDRPEVTPPAHEAAAQQPWLEAGVSGPRAARRPTLAAVPDAISRLAAALLSSSSGRAPETREPQARQDADGRGGGRRRAGRPRGCRPAPSWARILPLVVAFGRSPLAPTARSSASARSWTRRAGRSGTSRRRSCR